MYYAYHYPRPNGQSTSLAAFLAMFWRELLILGFGGAILLLIAFAMLFRVLQRLSSLVARAVAIASSKRRS
jgi:hypothetical protein